MDSTWIGVDFGTCFTSAAYLRDGAPHLVRIQGAPAVPSAAYATEDGRVLVGFEAERMGRDSPLRYKPEIKRALGTSQPIPLGDRQFLPEHLVEHVLREVRVHAEQQTGADSMRCVLTVPVRFAAWKQELMRCAAEAAGFVDVEIVREPVAAASYAAWRGLAPSPGEVILVYDLGGGTFDAALLESGPDGLRVMEQSVGDDALGGSDFDREIYDELVRASGGLPDEGSTEEDEEALARRLRKRFALLDGARGLKHQLTTELEATYELFSSFEEYRITRDQLNWLITPYLDRSCDICASLLQRAGVMPGRLSRVVLVGGSTRIPFVQRRVNERLRVPVEQVDEPDFAVCMGAALRAPGPRDRRPPPGARWRFQPGTAAPPDTTDAQVNAVALRAALGVDVTGDESLPTAERLRAAYDRLRTALQARDIFEAELATRTVIQLACGHAHVDSEEQALSVPAELLRALDRLWISAGIDPLHRRRCVSLSAFGMSSGRGRSLETWLQWRLRQLGLHRHITVQPTPAPAPAQAPA